MDNLPPLIPAVPCVGPLAVSTPVLIRSELEGPPMDGITEAAAIGQFSRVGPYPVIAPRVYAFDWFIAETLNSWRPVFT